MGDRKGAKMKQHKSGFLKKFFPSFITWLILTGFLVNIDEKYLLSEKTDLFSFAGILLPIICAIIVQTIILRKPLPQRKKWLRNQENLIEQPYTKPASFCAKPKDKKPYAQNLIDEAKSLTIEINNSATVFDFVYSYTEFQKVVQELIRLNEKDGIYMCPPPRRELERAKENIGASINDFISRAMGKIWSSGEQWADDVDFLLDEIEENNCLSRLLTYENKERISKLRKRAEDERNRVDLSSKEDSTIEMQSISSIDYNNVRPQSYIEVNNDMDKAARIIFQTKNPSVSMLERRTGWTYSKAARIMDSLEKSGIVGPFIGSMPRKILISSEDYARLAVIKQNICDSLKLDIDIDQILQDESEWRRQQQGLSPIEYELEQIDGMDGHAFECWCSDFLQKIGFTNVKVTQGSGDQGVDILAEKDGIRYAIQCKCYSSDLGNKPVQEVNAGKAIYRCQIGAVITNRYFTKGGKDAAEATGVLLWDRDWIQSKLDEIK